MNTTPKSGLEDPGIRSVLHYMGDGEVKRYLLELISAFDSSPYRLTAYQCGYWRTFTHRTWAIYLADTGRPRLIKDCLFNAGHFHLPATTLRSASWEGLVMIEKWLKRKRVRKKYKVGHANQQSEMGNQTLQSQR